MSDMHGGQGRKLNTEYHLSNGWFIEFWKFVGRLNQIQFPTRRGQLVNGDSIHTPSLHTLSVWDTATLGASPDWNPWLTYFTP